MEKEMRKLGANFSESALKPVWESIDAADPARLGGILAKAAEAGIFGFAVPESAGGSGLGAAEYSYFVEEVSRACAGAGVLFASHFAGVAPLLMAGGDRAHEILSGVAASEQKGVAPVIAAAVRDNAAPEFIPERIETFVDRSGSAAKVTGIKTNVVGAGAAVGFVVLARDAKSGELCWVFVPGDARGVEVRPRKVCLGLKICPVNDVIFSGVEVPRENVLVNFTEREKLLEYYRLVDTVFASVAIGISSEARDTAIKYSLERYQGGKMICDHDAVRAMLAEMDMSICAMKALARSRQEGILGAAFAAESAEKVCLDAIQTLGGYGYMKDYRIERMLRDAKTFRSIIDSRARRMESVRREIERMR